MKGVVVLLETPPRLQMRAQTPVIIDIGYINTSITILSHIPKLIT